jgi:hypothetical protein
MVAELVDNALASSDGNLKVCIDISPHPDGGDLYILSVWDNGPGIGLEKLEQDVFSLGHPPDGTSHLNEHGFGLKNVLAKAEQLSSMAWVFSTRDAEALKKGEFYQCTRPFSFAMPIKILPSAEWPKHASHGPGTICQIIVPMTYMQSVAFGRRGALPKELGRIMDYLREHLGVFYRGYLEPGIRATTHILTSINLGAQDHVDPITPDFQSRKTAKVKLTLGGRKVTITGFVGLVDKNSPQTKERLLYYKHAPESQGVDIRVGNRIVATRLISEIWERDRHPSLNGIAGEFTIPGTRGIAPPTLNNKTSIDFDSPTWHAIVEGIQQTIPNDELPHGGGKSEADLQEELYTHIRGLARANHTVEMNFDCSHGIAVDIVWDQTSTKGPLDIYEVKKGRAAPIDLYQLVMYWDAIVSNNGRPSKGHLVSDGHSTGVKTLLTFLRGRKDAKGNKYDLVLDEWAIHNINP